MNTQDIKKEFYKRKTEANISRVNKSYVIYICDLDEKIIYFNIPIEEIGDAVFYVMMPATQLTRWIVTPK